MEPMINVALRAAWEAENLINRMIDRPDLIKVRQDELGRQVTNLERSVEEVVLNSLRQHHPAHRFYTRNSGAIDGSDPGSPFLWTIDPLSGSENLLRGIPHFAFSITCEREQRIEHALIVDPLRRERFHASRGKGAQLGDTRIRVRGSTTLAGSALATAFESGCNGSEATQHNQALRRAREAGALLRESGCVALDLAYVAAGRLDGGWIIAGDSNGLLAGALLVTEAGGLVSDFHGGQGWQESGTMVAASPKCLKPLLQIINASN